MECFDKLVIILLLIICYMFSSIISFKYSFKCFSNYPEIIENTSNTEIHYYIHKYVNGNEMSTKIRLLNTYINKSV